MSQFALKLGYLPDSSRFSGFSHQLHDPTNIYTIIRKALTKARLIQHTDPVSYASRTDRGVGALSQIISFTSSNTPIISEINSYLPSSIRVISSTQVPEGFNPRKDALERTYSYFLVITDEFDVMQAKEVVNNLIGTHDFHNFAKLESQRPKNAIKTIKHASITEISHNIIQIQISSRSFLWQQIRRIISHLTQVATTELTVEYTKKLLVDKSENKKPSPAPPEPLLLEKITFKDIQFIADKKGVESFRKQLVMDAITYTTNLALRRFMLQALPKV